MHPTYKNRRHEADLEGFFLGPKSNAPIQEIPPENGPVHVECNIMRNVMASATEEELGALFENCHKATSIRTDLA